MHCCSWTGMARVAIDAARLGGAAAGRWALPHNAAGVAKLQQSFFFALYRAGVWLPSALALQISPLGLTALRAHAKLAEISLELQEPRFPLYPKYHMLLHVFYFLEWRSRQAEFVESPLTDCCQVDESFIGVVARLSRRVSPKGTVTRTVDVYLTSLWKHWESAR